MKSIKTLLILLSIAIFSCDNNDDAQTDPTNPSDGFTHNSVFYETENAYFEIDTDDPNAIPQDYVFFFLNGKMFDNDAKVNGSGAEYLFSLGTTNFVILRVFVSDNPSLANGGPLPGNTYVASIINDSVILENGQINPLTTPYFINGVEFGEGDEDTGIINTPIAPNPTITINAINLDNTNPSASSIDADYTFTNQDGDIITGQYKGSFGIILD